MALLDNLAFHCMDRELDWTVNRSPPWVCIGNPRSSLKHHSDPFTPGDPDSNLGNLTNLTWAFLKRVNRHFLSDHRSLPSIAEQRALV